jgi:peroxiredoxin
MAKTGLGRTVSKIRLLLGVGLAITLIAMGLPGQSSQMLAASKKAPDFTLPTLEGDTVSLSDFQGKLVLINFWATRCPPCRKEMPYLEELFREGNENLVILCINVGESASKVKGFADENDLSFTILLDANRKVYNSYPKRRKVIPITYLIDEQGEISKSKMGSFRNTEHLRSFALS